MTLNYLEQIVHIILDELAKKEIPHQKSDPTDSILLACLSCSVFPPPQ